MRSASITTTTAQRDAFVGTEGDAYFTRNATPHDEPYGYDRAIADLLPERPSILELGCADGRRLLRLEEMCPGGRYAGLEPSTTAVQHGNAAFTHLDLRIGSADAIPFDEQFDCVVLGFFLYVCDRSLLPRITAEVDRVLVDGGLLAIIDFGAPYPSRRPYHHVPGLHTYRMRYEDPFLAYPSYSLVHRTSSPMPGATRVDGSDDVVLTVLRKRLGSGYADET